VAAALADALAEFGCNHGQRQGAGHGGNHGNRGRRRAYRVSGEAGTGWQTMSEAKHADVSADAMRMADLIAKQMAKVGGT
jgi:hypothetical protein